MDHANEIKVLFLGASGSGKTQTVHRLIQNAEPIPGCSDHISPRGISVYHRVFGPPDGAMKIHFWDFGSDISYRRLERAFLTDMTVYVVLINARADGREKTARRWLRVIGEHAKQCPVILVLNSEDPSQNKGLNESALRKDFDNLYEVINISSCGDSDEVIESRLRIPFLNRIRKTVENRQPIPQEYRQVIRELREMQEDKISMDRFRKICIRNHVESPQWLKLLKLCTELGVCIWYNDSVLKDHIILRHDWLVNGLNAVFQESDAKDGRGVIRRCSIYNEILCHQRSSKEGVARIDERFSYEEEDADLIARILEKYQMLYELRHGKIFLPRICRSQMSLEAEADLCDPRNMEINVILACSVENLMFELMILMRDELADHAVWTEGFRLTREKEKLSAVIRADGEILRICVRGRDWRHKVCDYMEQIMNKVNLVLEDCDLQQKDIQKKLIYRCGDDDCELAYDMIMNKKFENAVMPLGRGGAFVRIGEIADSYGAQKPMIPLEPEDDRLICDILHACEEMQSDISYKHVNEDSRNRYIRSMLKMKPEIYTVLDQSQQGDGAAKKGPGEVDILIEHPDGTKWTIFEALNIKKGISDKSQWENHLFKLLNHYDKKGMKFLLLAAYTECELTKWMQVWRAYYEHMTTHNPINKNKLEDGTPWVRYELIDGSCQEYEPQGYSIGNKMKVAQCIYEIGGMKTLVIHIFVLIDRDPKMNAEGKEDSHEGGTE